MQFPTFLCVAAAIAGATLSAQSTSRPGAAKKSAHVERMAGLLGDPDSRGVALRSLASLGEAGRERIATAMRAEDDAIAYAAIAEMRRIAGDPRDRKAVKHAKTTLKKWEDDCYYLITDYSDNEILRVTQSGQVIHKLTEQYGVWDAEALPNGNTLIVEFALGRVVERDKNDKILWEFASLRNPYAAQRLANGNTLISDTYGNRVIEVTKAGQIDWQIQDIKPLDAERLPNGNTLISDGKAGRIIEVDGKGKVVWELGNYQGVWDVDRLENGNTLITQRKAGHSVIEVDKKGNVVFEIKDLTSPSDADRLPNGNTVVACDGAVEVFDQNADLVWHYDVSWAVEVNWMRAR